MKREFNLIFKELLEASDTIDSSARRVLVIQWMDRYLKQLTTATYTDDRIEKEFEINNIYNQRRRQQQLLDRIFADQIFQETIESQPGNMIEHRTTIYVVGE